MKRRMMGLGWSVALCVAFSGAQAAGPALSTFLEPGATSTSFWGVNNAGTAVGYSVLGDSERAFTWTPAGGFVPLALPDDVVHPIAMGISDGGTIVGSWFEHVGTDPGTGDPLLESRGFIVDGTGVTTYEIDGATDTHLRAISPDGRYVTGYYTDLAGVAGRGFVHDLATNTLQFIGAGGNDFTIAQGVSNAGVVVGSDRIRDDATWATLAHPGFVFDAASATRNDYNLPGAMRTAFRAIDGAGVISGWVTDGTGLTTGFAGFPGAVTLIYAGVAGTQTIIEGTNDLGWLVGAVVNESDGSRLALLALPVPEPASWALMLFGLTGIVGWSRRRR